MSFYRDFLFIIFAFLMLQSSAQHFTLDKCIRGEQQDILKGINYNTSQGNLMAIRSNSTMIEFERDDINGGFPCTWLFMMNAYNDTLWKRIIPNSDKALYTEYLPLITLGYFKYGVPDFEFSIHTSIGEEEILHYSYFDSVVWLNDGLLNYQNAFNNVLDFGILNQIDGSYKLEPFTIDTILKVASDTTLTTSMYKVEKLNDSIYQLLVSFSKRRPFNSYNIETREYLNLYTVNINSKSVVRNSYKPGNIKVFSVLDRFYVLEKINSPNSDLLLHKVGYDGLYEQTVSVKVRSDVPELDIISSTQDGKLIIGGRQVLSGAPSYTSSGILYTVNPSDLSFTVQEINMHPDNDFADNYIYPLVYKPDFDYYSYINGTAYFNSGLSHSTKTNPTPPYCILTEGYRLDDYSYNYGISIVKMDMADGIISWVKPSNMNVLDVLLNNNIIGAFNSYTTTSLYQNLYHNIIQKSDTGLNPIWEVSLPDTIRIDSLLYFANTEIIRYYPVNYKNHFMIMVNYIDTSNANSYYVKPFYFLISDSTGEFKQVNIQEELSPVSYYSLVTPLEFFTSLNNELIAVWNEENICEETSGMDIAFYRYDELISSNPSNLIKTASLLSVYPNPAADRLNVQLNKEFELTNALYTIYDITGKLCFSGRLTHNNLFDIDISSLNSGLFLMVVSNEKESVVQKFQKLK
jgi:hypothetical protein